MSLHRLTEITLGVPNLKETVEYYTDFGLTPLASSPGQDEHWFSTVDGGRQMRIVKTPIRKLLSVGVGVDDRDDLQRIASSLRRLNVASHVEGDQLETHEPVTGLNVIVTATPRLKQQTRPLSYNSPGNILRPNVRAMPMPGRRPEPVRPRKLGHISIGSTNKQATQRFFGEGIGFKVSDEVGDLATFMRCSSDHHNLVVNAAPVYFLHHTSWEVDDIDEIGRGARSFLEGHPERHLWGVGRHFIGSNFFYYFRDPAGNFSEYYSDMDEIIDDQLWKPGVFDMADALGVWGPEIGPSGVQPDDLAELMADLH
jgi:catechol 2,3-dioxygenase-like lactoylglutathione lyase family enzyme